jgi:Skp family chaperone for outer membrane proteins
MHPFRLPKPQMCGLFFALEMTMKLAHKSALAALLILGLAALSRGQATAAPAARGTAPAAAPPPTKLAVVNVVELFDGLTEKRAADQDIAAMKTKFEDESRKMKAVIDAADAGLQNSFVKGSPELRQAQDDLLHKATDLQSYNTFAQQRLFLELRIRTADIYRKINEAIAKYAAANGIALVFVADNSNVDNASTQEQLQAMVTVRKILYFHPDFDITGKIKLMMNTEYELGKVGKP